MVIAWPSPCAKTFLIWIVKYDRISKKRFPGTTTVMYEASVLRVCAGCVAESCLRVSRAQPCVQTLYRGGVRASEARRTRRGEPRTAGGGFATDIASHEPTFQGRNKGWEDGEGGGGECGEERHPMLISRSKCPSRMCGVRGRVVPSSKSGPALSADCQGKLCTTVMDALPSI